MIESGMIAVLVVVVIIQLWMSFQLDSIAARLRCVERQGGQLMALSDEVRAAVEAVKTGVDQVIVGQGEAIADIQALHVKVDGFLDVGDIAAARAALAEVAPKLEALAASKDALAAAVAVPE